MIQPRLCRSLWIAGIAVLAATTQLHAQDGTTRTTAVDNAAAAAAGSAAPSTDGAASATSAPAASGAGMSARHYMKAIDWVVIAAYGVLMLAIGYYFSLRTGSREEYLLGGRNMRSSSVGLSLFATLFSTITYLALPGELIAKGPVILWSMVAIPVAYVVVGYFLIPYFMKLRVTSAYEILETRLGLSVRLLGSTIFLLTRMFWMALIIYITSKKLIVVMMGLDPGWTPYVAALIGLVTVAYTSMGGLRAVVMTDVIQSLILLGGALVAILTITIRMGGVGAWWPHEWSPTWDNQPLFLWDLSQRATVIGSIVFMTVWWICTAGSDQMAIQRYLATRDAKTARRVFLITGLSNILVTTLLAGVGLALLGFFQQNPGLLETGMNLAEKDTADILFPYYIIRFIPPGVTGLVVAGLLAAAMSSLSSGINSSCSVISVDFLERFRAKGKAISEARQMWQTKIIAIGAGLFAVMLSSVMGRVTGNIMEVTVRTNHVFAAPLFGLFIMAMFVPFATTFGTVMGALSGCGIAVVIAYWDLLTKNVETAGPITHALATAGGWFGFAPGVSLSFQWISLIALVVNLAVALPLSYVTYREVDNEK